MDDDFQLTPVRMLTQYAYCPRLAYLEWVQSEWADNYYTEDGNLTHRRVDVSSERPDAPVTRSLHISAPIEGLTTKLDLLEQQEDEAVPVEYKRGRIPRQGPGLSDKVQLCAQALVLRENGWNCRRGYVYYSDSKSRCEVLIDDELVELTRNLLCEMRARFEAGVIPEPLLNDSRCGDCSLNAICLPEEVNFLRRSSESVRPLWAAHDEGQPLHVTEHGTKIGISGDELILTKDGDKVGKARLIEVSQVNLHGNVQLSTQALRALAKLNIPVLYFSFGNWFSASVTGLPHKNIELRREQFKAAFNTKRSLSIARAMVTAKISNQRVLLRRNGAKVSPEILRELKQLRIKATKAPSQQSLLGIEGLAGRFYFQEFPKMLKLAEVSFDGRNRRPPTDPVNAVLSFCYAMLVKEATIALYKVGFDPYQGFYHQGRFGRPSLALDLMEEFRPLLAASTVLSLFNNKQLGADDFIFAGSGCAIRQRAKKAVVAAFERRMNEELTHPIFKYRASYRRTLVLQARLLARHILGELDVYPGLETR